MHAQGAAHGRNDLSLGAEVRGSFDNISWSEYQRVTPPCRVGSRQVQLVDAAHDDVRTGVKRKHQHFKEVAAQLADFKESAGPQGPQVNDKYCRPVVRRQGSVLKGFGRSTAERIVARARSRPLGGAGLLVGHGIFAHRTLQLGRPLHLSACRTRRDGEELHFTWFPEQRHYLGCTVIRRAHAG